MDGILFKSFLNIVPITHEVVFLILLWLVSWWTFFPVVSDSFSSLIEFDVLLNSEVGTSVSVFQPVDALSLDNQADYYTREGGIIVKVVACIWSHVLIDTYEEDPEREIVKLLNSDRIRLLLANWVQKRSWVTKNNHGNGGHKLKVSHVPSDLEE